MFIIVKGNNNVILFRFNLTFLLFLLFFFYFVVIFRCLYIYFVY